MFPDDGKTDVITCSTLTQDFLIFATEVSGIKCCVIHSVHIWSLYFVGWYFALLLYRRLAVCE